MQTYKFRYPIIILLLSSYLLVNFSCGHSSSKSNGLKRIQLGNKKNAFDLKASDIESRDEYDINDLFDSIRYIPLQTTRESLFSQINQMEVTKNYIVIRDDATKSILVFEKNGTFKFRLKSKQIDGFTIDDAKDHIVFIDKLLQKTFTYDFKGQLISVKKPKFDYVGIAHLGPNLTAYYRFFFPANDLEKFNNFNIVVSDDSGIVKKAFLPYDTAVVNYTEIGNSPKSFYKSNKNVYFIQPDDYKIFYNLDNSILPDYFTINLPEKNTLPEDFLTNEKYYNKRWRYLKDNPYQTRLIMNLYIIDSLMSFEVSASEWNDIFLYDIKKKKAISVFNFLSGPKNNYLPPGLHFLAADDKCFYRSVSAKQLFEPRQAHQTQLSYATLPKEMKLFYDTQNNLSNPVVIQLFPKKTLIGLKNKRRNS
ncbi:6-bladed beta-propeller [Mucilaginibacter sp. UYCu711]|uniref:6-bladed beta-propeller n=1 Tax=Mucilaginibacter sp. UYCu711 TaxID=3156339 RepID=UPI003D1C4794